jgi:RNA polymerase sigma-70 factor (ECF subfamily)
MDEQQAVARLKQGDLSGLEFLVQRYQVKAVHTAYLIIGDLPAAEDVVQTVFLRAAKKIHQFDDRRPFHSWLLKIVVNDAVKESKRQKRHISMGDPTDEILNWLTDTGPRPEELAESNELCRAVWSAIQRLAPEQRAVIVQRHFLEMSEAEMAVELQRPSSTIKWWLYSARERLKALLDAYHQGL